MLFSHTKSLIAGVVALLAVICAALWLWNRTIVLQELTQTAASLKTQIQGSQVYPAMIADCREKLDAQRTDIGKITDKFVGKDYEAPKLMRAIVQSAGASGMEMTDAAKQGQKNVLAAQSQGLNVQALAYTITLKGSYLALVKFLQNIAAWKIGHRIESIEISPVNDGREDKIEAALVLSVFSMDK
jgi:Tfp pilus assembly protein PilO